ncbi:M56 family metallopeptidase [Aquimarina intermedia]|nr:M56 family metallopeptidase [Aquimarina intermedia]
MHTYKRGYLLLSLVASFTIPLVTLTYYTDAIATLPDSTIPSNEVGMANQFTATPVVAANYFDWTTVLWGVYITGVLVFGFRFIRNLIRIQQRIKSNPIVKEPSHVKVLCTDTIAPYSFLRYIFLPFQAFRANAIPNEIVVHEEAHVVEKHSWDILFLECIQVLFWFNPLLILFRIAMKLNHEFLADSRVLKSKSTIETYQNLLITFPNSLNQTELSSAFNYSLTKKRLQMMSTHFSSKNAALRLFGAVPVFGLCTVLFCNDIVAQTQPNTQETATKEIRVIEAAADDQQSYDPVTSDQITQYNNWAQKVTKGIQSGDFGTIKKAEVAKMQAIYKGMTPEQRGEVAPFPTVPAPPLGQAKVTNAMITAYNAWAKDATNQLENNDQVTIFDYGKMSAIYKQMSKEQKAKAEKFPDLPEPPPAPAAPIPSGTVPPPPPPPAPVSKGEHVRTTHTPAPAPIAPMSAHEQRALQKEIEKEVEAAMIHEQEELEAFNDIDVEVMVAMEKATLSREQARIEAEIARSYAEVAHERAHRASKSSQLDREEVRKISEKARKQAMKHAKKARKEALKARKDMRKIREEALQAAQQARVEAQAVRVESEKIRREAMQAAREARMEALQAMKKEREEAAKKKE